MSGVVGDVFVELDQCTKMETSKDYTGEDIFLYNDHYVGKDGFLVPNSTEEFFERYPIYVEKSVRYLIPRKLPGFKFDEETIRDIVSELSLKICTGTIAYFDPIKQFGCSRNKFFNLINITLFNRFLRYTCSNINRNPAVHSKSIKKSSDDEEDSGSYLNEESAIVGLVPSHEDGSVLSIFLNGFVDYAKRKLDSDKIDQVLNSIVTYNSISEARRNSGMPEIEFTRVLDGMRKLAKEFEKVGG